jgi:Protein of unknown function (DUF3102)
MELEVRENAGRSLEELRNTINTEHRLAETAARNALEHARNAGEALNAVKTQVGHGGLIPWVNASCACSVRTAQRYMRLAREWPRLVEANATRVSHLSVREALALLADRREQGTDEPEVVPVPLPAPGHATLGSTGDEEHVLVELAYVDEPSYYLTLCTPTEVICFSTRPVLGSGVDLVVRSMIRDLGSVEWGTYTREELRERGFELHDRNGTDVSAFHRLYRAAWLYPDTGNPRLNAMETKILQRVDLCSAGRRDEVVNAIRTIHDEGLYQGAIGGRGPFETFDAYLRCRFDNYTGADLMKEVELASDSSLN